MLESEVLVPYLKEMPPVHAGSDPTWVTATLTPSPRGRTIPSVGDVAVPPPSGGIVALALAMAGRVQTVAWFPPYSPGR